MLPHSRHSPSDPSRPWPQGKALLAGYHGLDLAGQTSAAVSTKTIDRMLGYKLPLGLGFLDHTSTWAALNTVDRSFGGYVGLRDGIICSTPMMPDDGTTLAQVAAGAGDVYFQAVAADIKNLGFLSPIIRIGWEFNGNWYPWAARNLETNYIAAFRQMVNVFRAVPGWTPQFLWNPDKKAGRYAQSTYADPPDCYPGDDYVDFLGVDAYNGWVNGVNAPTKNANGSGGAVAAGDFPPYPIPTQAARWNNELVGTLGSTVAGTAKPFCLEWTAHFADLHGKQIIIPEWGTGYDGTRAGENCGDDGYYVEQMAAWLEANDVYAHGYWDRITGDYNARLSYESVNTGDEQDDKPAARAAFVAAFGYSES